MATSKVKKQSTKVKVVAKKASTSSVKTVGKPVKKGMNVPVFALDGKKKGTTELPKEIFGVKVNDALMAQAVRVYLVNQRQGTASTKTRGEINKTTAKWYRQKGTGRARHGAKSAPIFVGGGVAFGPRPRSFELKLSKQMRKKALFSALTQKLTEDKVYVVDQASLTGKTKQMTNLFNSLSLLSKKSESVLLLGNVQMIRASRNIENVEAIGPSIINTYSVLKSKYLVLSKDSIEKLVSTFQKGNEA